MARRPSALFVIATARVKPGPRTDSLRDKKLI